MVDNSMFDLSQVPQSALIMPLWWDEIKARKLNHVTTFNWVTEKRPNPAVDFPGVSILSSQCSAYAVAYLLWMDDTLIDMTWARDGIGFHVASKSAAFSILEAKFRAAYPEAVEDDEKRVALKFWFNAPNGMGAAYVRMLDVPEWPEVEENYGGNIREEMTRLTAKEFRPSHGGQLMLWQGPPGTGKTFAIRALVREWAKWCDASYIVDPDAFFHNANYMMQVMLDEPNNRRYAGLEDDDEEDDFKVRWKLVILEDSGELLTADAKQRTGQALSRLLNIADGLIGQGLKVLILITTNEEMDSLHEAVSRPGRCASKIVFPRLSKEESNEWLAKRELPPGDKDHSLAELYGEVEGFTKKAEKERPDQREMGFAVPKKPPVRRALGFDTGTHKESPAPEVGPPSEHPDEIKEPLPVARES